MSHAAATPQARKQSSSASLRLGVPAYFRTAAGWQTMIAAAPHIAFAVLNPASGPDAQPRASYQRVIAQARAAGITIVGYVATNYGARRLATVQQQIAQYVTWYEIDGIMLDEASNTEIHLPYYAALAEYMRTAFSRALAIILNPGAPTSEASMPLCDIVCTAEMDAATYLTSPPSIPDWVQRYPAERFWHIVHGVSTPHQTRRIMRAARQRHAGRLYLTDGRLPNPYGALPAPQLWETLLAALP